MATYQGFFYTERLVLESAWQAGSGPGNLACSEEIALTKRRHRALIPNDHCSTQSFSLTTITLPPPSCTLPSDSQPLLTPDAPISLCYFAGRSTSIVEDRQLHREQGGGELSSPLRAI